jgi:hypothetical protein
MMVPVPLTVQTLYAELLESPRGILNFAGSLYEKKISDSRYLYRKETVGGRRQDQYLGKVGVPATETLRRDTEFANLTAGQRRELVKMLKTQLPTHLTGLARMMIVLQHFGILENPKTVLVGTNAYICYPALVGYRLDHAVMATDDADLATVDLKTSDAVQRHDLLSLLRHVDESFRAIPELSKKSLPSRFVSNSGLRLDFITQQRSSKTSGTVALKNLNAGATPLQHISWLIELPAKAAILSDVGALVYVPQPARFAIHKLLLAQKRTSVDRLKRQKDLMQSKSLINALLLSDPHSLRDAYESACAQGTRGWAVPIRKSLAEIGVAL